MALRKHPNSPGLLVSCELLLFPLRSLSLVLSLHPHQNFFLFLELDQLVPASGSLCIVPFTCNAFPTDIYMKFKCHLLKKAFPDHSTSPVTSLHFLHSAHHLLERSCASETPVSSAPAGQVAYLAPVRAPSVRQGLCTCSLREFLHAYSTSRA